MPMFGVWLRIPISLRQSFLAYKVSDWRRVTTISARECHSSFQLYSQRTTFFQPRPVTSRHDIEIQPLVSRFC